MEKTARGLVVNGKGILAADESTGTIKKRLESVGVEDSVENHRRYRELLFTTPGLEKFISGVIMFEETLRQSTQEGKPFPRFLEEKGIIPGIKVDQGKKPMHDSSVEFVTQGLEGLNLRLREYKKLGAKFTKWRAIFVIGENMPSKDAISINANLLAKYAAVAQEEGFVPIVEPEVLMDGDHDIGRCEEVTTEVLKTVFEELVNYHVKMDSMLLKPNMVISGSGAKKKATTREVAEATIRTLKSTVPDEVPGIVFLSGGQSPGKATQNLATLNREAKDAPWKLSFSFGRALQAPVLKTWLGKDENRDAAQAELIKVAAADGKATLGIIK